MRRLTRRGFLRAIARGSAAAGFAGLWWSLTGCGPISPAETPSAGLMTFTATSERGPSPILESPIATPSAILVPESPTTAPSPVPTRHPSPTPGPADLAIMRGPAPEAITRAAIAALGGMGRFVKKDDSVIVKPNICVSHGAPENAYTTNPEVVGALVKMCLEAGAREVRVMDLPFSGTPAVAYERSGIQGAVKRAGGRMEVMASMKYQEVPIPEGKDIKSWTFYRDVLDVDVLINVPIAKHHSTTWLTLGMKNLMGVILERGQIHWNIGQRIADLTSLVRPDLTVMDAVRMLMANGPASGTLDDVRRADTVIAGTDIVAVDSYATTLFSDMQGLVPEAEDIEYIQIGHEMGLGEIDWRKLRVVEENIM